MKTQWRNLLGLPAAAALMAQAPVSADPPARSDYDVVVAGERASADERRDRARAFVADSGVANGEQAVARWVDPMCVKVIGPERAIARAVEARVRKIAATAAVPLAAAPCRANALIAFVANGPAAMRHIAAKRSSSLMDVAPRDHAALVEGIAPARWWYSVQARSSDGEPASATSGPTVRMERVSGELPGNMNTTFQKVSGSSFVNTQSMRAIYSANVILDVNQMEGFGLGSVADFAAFVLLAEVRPLKGEKPDSILGLFGKDGQRSLTEWDATFLSELYRLPLNRSGRRQRQMLTSAILDNASKSR